jgi:hypothetical protein
MHVRDAVVTLLLVAGAPAAAGSASMSGGVSWATKTWIP